jgi:hypothetical protein
MSAEPAPAPQLRPLALGEILDVSIKLVRRNWRTLATLVLIAAVPVAIVSLLITTSTTTYDPTTDVRTREDGSAYGAGVAVHQLLQLVLYLLAAVACFGAIADGYLGRRPEWRSSLRFAARRAPMAFVMGILAFLGIVAGFIALIIPGVFLAVRWSVALPALLLERRGPVAALGRSWRLVKGFWWKVFGTLLVTYLLVRVAGFAVSAIVVAGLTALTSAQSFLGLALTEAVDVVVQLFTLPVLAAVTIVLYVDLRVRKEGFDLALMADHIAQREQAAQAFGPVERERAPTAGVGPSVETGPQEPAEPARHPAFGE